MIIKMNAYKTTQIKIEIYDEKYGKFEGLNNNIDIKKYKIPRDN